LSDGTFAAMRITACVGNVLEVLRLLKAPLRCALRYRDIASGSVE